MSKKFKVLSIDAWAEGDGWTWNNWSTCGEFNEEEYGPLTEETALDYFFNEFVTITREEFNQRYEIDDDQYNLVIVTRASQQPLFAIEYGSL